MLKKAIQKKKKNLRRAINVTIPLIFLKTMYFFFKCAMKGTTKDSIKFHMEEM